MRVADILGAVEKVLVWSVGVADVTSAEDNVEWSVNLEQLVIEGGVVVWKKDSDTRHGDLISTSVYVIGGAMDKKAMRRLSIEFQATAL